MCAQQRPLIVPWLVEQLDAQQYPGVAWLNPERTRFRVPWKHGSRQSISTEDFQLFEGWAIASGRFNPKTDKRTPSEWKRNFRAALNRKSEIQMVEDNSTDSDDPHKVFEIQPPTGCDRGVAHSVSSVAPSTLDGSMGAHGDSSSSSQDDTLESVLNSLDISGLKEGPGTENPLSYGGLPYNLDPAPPEAPVSPLQEIMETNKLETDFEVRAYYRGQLVFSRVFNNVKGLCFVPTGFCGNYPELADVVLPAPNTIHDQLQVSLTERILQGLVPGVVLRTEGASLLGTRRGPSHVYWNHSEFPAVVTPRGELPKEQFSCLYNLQHFVQELIGYMEKQNGSPNYSLWLCFGEEWPDAHRSWKKKLIMVQVIVKTFEMLYQLSQAGGASSLGEVERDLRISDTLQGLEFLAQLREWEEKMEVEFHS
ncbi:interferon regulatory factor 3 isoform X1 [Tiliqua scincoides]|uniref:interferon regulatory factor 3 isoform X1 n=1 Tax=Tiliqua scincoides TaxID=71010 RepID=UPI0034621F32